MEQTGIYIIEMVIKIHKSSFKNTFENTIGKMSYIHLNLLLYFE